MSLRFVAGATLGTIFAAAATPLTIAPILGVGALTGVATLVGGTVGKYGGLALGAIAGGLVGSTQNAETAGAGAAVLGGVSFVLGAIAGPIVGGVMGYNASVDYFAEDIAKENDSSAYIQQVDSNTSELYSKNSEGNYVLPAQAPKLAA